MTNEEFIASIQRERAWHEQMRREWQDADYRARWWAAKSAELNRSQVNKEREMNAIYTTTLNRVPEFVDPRTGEVNLTWLAEAVCQELDGYEGDDIPEEYFEAAAEAADYYLDSRAP